MNPTSIPSSARRSRFRIGLGLALLAAVSVFLGLAVVEGISSLLLKKQQSLVFPPDTSVAYETSEFHFTASINSKGFRDSEPTKKSDKVLRVVAIGDSFVYGWGVEIEDAWPKVLEAALKAKGRAVEILDLGCPGAGPSDYLETARRAIPALSPDVVVIGILQGDDVMQERIRLDAPVNAPRKSMKRRIGEFVAPNLVALLAGQRHLKHVAMPAIALRDKSKREVQEFLATATPEQKARLSCIDRTSYQMWLDGDLNPYVLISALKRPDYFSFTLDPGAARVREAEEHMSASIREIRELAESRGARVIVVDEPYSAYVIDDGRDRKYGFNVPAFAATGTAQDDVIKKACEHAGVDCFCVTEAFRHEASRQKLYYTYDGHYTPAGHKLLADSIAQGMLAQMDHPGRVGISGIPGSPGP